MIAITQFLYEDAKCYVKYNNVLGHFVMCKNGLLLGEGLSPIIIIICVC